MKRWVSGCLALAIVLLAALCLPGFAEETPAYVAYMDIHANTPLAEEAYVIRAVDYTNFSGAAPTALYDGEMGEVLRLEEETEVTYTVTIENEGLYALTLAYYPVEGKSSDIMRGLLIDGKTPFEEARSMAFSRVWADESPDTRVDTFGNDLKQRQIEAPRWMRMTASDARGYYGHLLFYLPEGTHTLTLVPQREPLLLAELSLKAPEIPLPYEEMLSIWRADSARATQDAAVITIAAEKASAKSTPMLYGISDNSSPAVTPYSPRYVKINTIGGEQWATAGQWIEWTFDVPQTGLYSIAMNVKQNFVRGVPVKRKLTIDGAVPFAEAAELDFTYKNAWRVQALGEEAPYLFYLTAGEHTLRLEAVLGGLSDAISRVDSAVRVLNDAYRRVMMITGSAPDTDRDYQLGKKLPGLVDTLLEQREVLMQVSQGVRAQGEDVGDKLAALNTMILLIDTIAHDVEKFLPNLSEFKTAIGGLGTWIAQMQNLALQIDEIYILPPGAPLPRTNNSFWARCVHELSTIGYSFIVDYNAIGSSVDDSAAQREITVWVSSGRDQANVLKALIDETFTPDTGIRVNLMLVQADSLLQATLAGQGPDVALQVTNNLPMNYAMRGAVMDLSGFEGFAEVTGRFNESALTPYRYESACYALPETQTFPVLFYRADILSEQGLSVPETWDDVKAMISTLSKNNMTFGLAPNGAGISYASTGTQITPEMSYGIFLYQMGGEFYTQDRTASALDSDVAVAAFKEWTKYYTDYTLDREFDFVNRFRTGEMPIGVADYSVYNTLQVAAPEIQGLWGFTQVPGTVREDGSVDHTVPSTGQAAVIMQQSRDPQSAWDFLCWWTSEETQIAFGREMEGLMGAAARYPTANMQALSRLPWPVRDYQNLAAQFADAKGVPEVPGGYFTGRNLNNAFYSVVIEQNIGARESLMNNVRFINDEITYKRKELGLDAQ